MSLSLKEYLEYAHLGLSEKEIELAKKRPSPLNPSTKYDIEHPGFKEFKLMQDPNYLFWAAKILLNIELLPYQAIILKEMWNHTFPMVIASRGAAKSFSLAVYFSLRCALIPESKIVCVGAAFRQSKVIFEYMENIWMNAPILRSVFGSRDGPSRTMDMYTMDYGTSKAIFIPLGTGDKIRGLRASIVAADEFESIDPAIYETVVSGFAAVSKSPVERSKNYAKRKILKELGKWGKNQQEIFEKSAGNQSILSGTCGYDFGHFASYWKKYKSIIYGTMNEDNNGIKITDRERSKYCIIRLPYELIPEGIMDEDIVNRAKATMHTSTYQMEYAACFPKDSTGFFKRTLINSCTTTDTNPIIIDGKEIIFDARTFGDPEKKYVFGVDPASEVDNFSIVILELNDTHRRVVYCWTINRKKFKRRVQLGIVQENDFYGYCARKIRELMHYFPCAGIAIDAQGGGIAVAEALQDNDKFFSGEEPIYPIIEEGKEKDTDLLKGLHILHMCQFANANWTAEANHGLRKDMEDKQLIFPRFDSVTLELAHQNDVGRLIDTYHPEDQQSLYKQIDEGLYDTLEDCIMEVETLKDELCTIIHTRTGTGVNSRDRWDTPETRGEGGKKTRLLKDRYSSLLMANMIARQMARTAPTVTYKSNGKLSGSSIPHGNFSRNSQLYAGPDWFSGNMKGKKPRCVKRRRN